MSQGEPSSWKREFEVDCVWNCDWVMEEEGESFSSKRFARERAKDECIEDVSSGGVEPKIDIVTVVSNQLIETAQL